MNLCAFPGCKRKIIAEPTSFDSATITGQIAHIYSRSSRGPRPYPYKNPTKELINAFDNLILLCADCHTLIDDRDKTYTAQQIKFWKQEHISGHMSILRSFLPHQHRTSKIHNKDYRVCTIDATLKKARDISKDEKTPDNQIKKVEKLDLHFTSDDGVNFQEIWPSLVFPCQENGRVTFLLIVEVENGAEHIFSFHVHRSGWNEWIRWPGGLKVRAPVSVLSRKILWISLGMFLATFTMIVLSLFNYLEYSIWMLVPGILGALTCTHIISNGRGAIVKLLESAQKDVELR